MKGGFKCPHCKVMNACTCEACSPSISEGDTIPLTVEGEGMQCGKCEEWFSYDQALDEEYKTYKDRGKISEEDIREAATKWVFETNGDKWSNNNNECGDNLGSFIAGAEWVLEKLNTKL